MTVQHTIWLAGIALLCTPCSCGIVMMPSASREAASRNPQVGFTTDVNMGSFGAKRSTYIPESAPWMDVPHEIMRFPWRDLYSDTGVDTAPVEKVLANLAKRGKQGILAIQAHSTRTVYIPEHLLSLGNMTCKDINGQTVAAYTRPEMIAAIEETAQKLGAAFNGDKRLFAVEVGFVGHDGRWRHAMEEDANAECQLPDIDGARRIIGAVAGAFSETFVLMPRPWNAPQFPYVNYPNMGLVDATFLTEQVGAELEMIGLDEVWKTAPVLASMADGLDRTGCWFDEDFDPAGGQCQSVARELPPFEKALSISHPSTVSFRSLLTLNKDDSDLMARVKEVYLSTGAQLHLSGVAMETHEATVSVCVRISNIGSAPFYAPAASPLKLMLQLGSGEPMEVQPATGKTLSAIMPNASAVFSQQLGFESVTDECVTYGQVCTAEGQTCTDDDTSPHSRGDWYCVCAGKDYRERAKPAVCGFDTVFQQDETRWYDRAVPDHVAYDGEAWVEASYSASLWVKMATCLSRDCTAPNVYAAQIFTIMGSQKFADTTSAIRGRSRMGVQFRYKNEGYYVDVAFHKECAGVPGAVVTVNTLSEWHNVVYTYSKETLTYKIYINGVLTATCDNVEPLRAAAPVTLGRAYGDATKSMVGWLRDVRFMKGAVTAKEVAVLATDRIAALEPKVAIKLWLDTAFKQRAIRFATADPNLDADTGVYAAEVPPLDASAKAGAEACAAWTAPPPTPPSLRTFDPTVTSVEALFAACKTLVVKDAGAGGLPDADAVGCLGSFTYESPQAGWLSAGAQGFGPRSLYPDADGAGVSCTTGVLGTEGGRFFYFTAAQFSEVSECAEVMTTVAPGTTDAPVETDAPAKATDAPAAPTDTPAAQTDAPAAQTAAPSDATSAPTDAPVVAQTDAPAWVTGAPTATPAGQTDTDAPAARTDVPSTGQPAGTTTTAAPTQATQSPSGASSAAPATVDATAVPQQQSQGSTAPLMDLAERVVAFTGAPYTNGPAEFETQATAQPAAATNDTASPEESPVLSASQGKTSTFDITLWDWRHIALLIASGVLLVANIVVWILYRRMKSIVKSKILWADMFELADGHTNAAPEPSPASSRNSGLSSPLLDKAPSPLSFRGMGDVPVAPSPLASPQASSMASAHGSPAMSHQSSPYASLPASPQTSQHGSPHGSSLTAAFHHMANLRSVPNGQFRDTAAWGGDQNDLIVI